MVICGGDPKLRIRLQYLFIWQFSFAYQAQMDHGRVALWVEVFYVAHDGDGGQAHLKPVQGQRDRSPMWYVPAYRYRP